MWIHKLCKRCVKFRQDFGNAPLSKALPNNKNFFFRDLLFFRKWKSVTNRSGDHLSLQNNKQSDGGIYRCISQTYWLFHLLKRIKRRRKKKRTNKQIEINEIEVKSGLERRRLEDRIQLQKWHLSVFWMCDNLHISNNWSGDALFVLRKV